MGCLRGECRRPRRGRSWWALIRGCRAPSARHMCRNSSIAARASRSTPDTRHGRALSVGRGPRSGTPGAAVPHRVLLTSHRGGSRAEPCGCPGRRGCRRRRPARGLVALATSAPPNPLTTPGRRHGRHGGRAIGQDKDSNGAHGNRGGPEQVPRSGEQHGDLYECEERVGPVGALRRHACRELSSPRPWPRPRPPTSDQYVWGCTGSSTGSPPVSPAHARSAPVMPRGPARRGPAARRRSRCRRGCGPAP
jgi:hypothetical protein